MFFRFDDFWLLQRAARRHAVGERKQGDGRRGFALSLFDAGELAVNSGERALLAEGKFLAGAGAHREQDVIGVNGVERTRWCEGGLGAGDFRDELHVHERAQNRL